MIVSLLSVTGSPALAASPTRATAVAPADADASPEALGRRWIAPGGKLDARALDPMVRLLRQDAEGNELLKGVLARMGATDPVALLGVLHLVPSLPGAESGLFYELENAEVNSLPPPGTAPTAAAAVAAAAGIETRVRITPTVRLTETVTERGICLRSGMNVFDSFVSLAHEMRHFLGTPAFTLRDEDVLAYRDADDYVARELVRPGGEFEAYVSQGGVGARLARRAGVRWRDTLARYFDADGRLIDRDGLVHDILDIRGYRSSLKNQFNALVVRQFNEATRELRMHRGEMLDIARQNADISEGNVKAYRNNENVYRQRGLASEATKAHQGLADAERDAKFYRDYFAKIGAEGDRLETRRREIARKFPDAFAGGPPNLAE